MGYQTQPSLLVSIRIINVFFLRNSFNILSQKVARVKRDFISENSKLNKKIFLFRCKSLTLKKKKNSQNDRAFECFKHKFKNKFFNLPKLELKDFVFKHV